MGRESLRIVARHDIGITLDAFEELYEALSVPGSGVTVPSLPSEPSPPVAERARRAERAAPYEPN